jgi:hypothetical protein
VEPRKEEDVCFLRLFSLYKSEIPGFYMPQNTQAYENTAVETKMNIEIKYFMLQPVTLYVRITPFFSKLIAF